jgi:A/G-specific adenine glycosylase
VQDLRDAVFGWHAEHGRDYLPWRASRNPYHVVVSEFMLQQTQVERVLAAFEGFIDRFDSFASLAAATRAEVVRAWKGLGYNLRAIRLHELARAVVERHQGSLPSDAAALRALPGVGPYTVAAIRAFAFEIDDVAIDVNLRRIVHRLRFGIEHPPKASASEVDETARALLARGRAHAWNSALMDLGALICTARSPKCSLCPLREWCAAAPLSATIAKAASEQIATKGRGPQAKLRFEQTRRYARGRVLDRLREAEPGTVVCEHELVAVLNDPSERYPLGEILAGLERDGFLVRDAGGVRLR